MGRLVPITRLVYVFLIIFAAIFIYSAQSLPPARSGADIGPSLYPVTLAVLIILFAGSDAIISRNIHKSMPIRELTLTLSTSAVMFATIWLSTIVGFFIVLPIASFATLWIAGSKRLVVNAIFSLAFAGVLWVFFDHFLGIPLHSL